MVLGRVGYIGNTNASGVKNLKADGVSLSKNLTLKSGRECSYLCDKHLFENYSG